jgi:hypothetical protein
MIQMKLHELLIENKNITEAPMSGLATLGNKAMAKFGGDARGGRATGKLNTGTLANQLHKEFQIYLGSSGREATKDAVIGFLSSKGYPTQGASQIINQALKGQGAAPSGALANMKATAKGAMDAAKNKFGSAVDAAKSKLAPKDAAAEPEKIEPTGDVAPVEPASKGSFNNQLVGGKASYSQATHFDPATMKNATTPISSDEVPDPKKKKVAVSASKINRGNPLSEAPIPGVLSQSVIDKAFLKAAQENDIIKNKQGRAPGQSPKVTSTNANTDTDASTSTGNKGGFGAGFKKGFTGKPAATPDLAGLEQRIAAIEKKVGLA